MSEAGTVSRFGGRALAGRASLKLIGEGAARAMAFLVTLWVARALGAEAFGLYAYALAASFVLAQGTDLGLNVLLSREVAVEGRRAQTLVRDALYLKLLLALPVLALLGGLAILRSSEGRIVVTSLGLAMIFRTFVDYAAHVFRGRGRIAEEVRLTTGAAFITAGATALALVLQGTLVAVALSSLAAAGLAAGIALRRLAAAEWLLPSGPRSRGDWFSTRRGLRLLRAAAPLGVAVLLSIAYWRLPVLMLERLSGEVAVGHFSVAQRLVEATLLFPAAAMAAVFPAYASRWRRSPPLAEQLAVRVGGILLAAGLAVAAFLFLKGPWLVGILFGNGYRQGGEVLAILGLSVPLLFLNYLLLHLLIARGRQEVVTGLSGLVLILQGALCWHLIPSHGPLGAAVGVLVSELVLLLGSGVGLALARPAPSLLAPAECPR